MCVGFSYSNLTVRKIRCAVYHKVNMHYRVHQNRYYYNLNNIYILAEKHVRTFVDVVF